jgi:LacI family transcriptional regulator
MSMVMHKKRPTMEDVARLSGVSQTTVSFVINDVPHVNISERTRATVMTAVRQLGYTPNALAIGLRTNQTRVIGLVTDEIATTPFAGRIIQGAQQAAREKQRLLMLMDSGRDAGTEDQEIGVLLGRQVDGIIFATMRHRVIVPSRMLYQIPSVLLDCRAADRSLPSVVPDEFLGGYQAAEALLQKGHRRIGMINTAEDVPAGCLREQGFRRACEAHGASLEEGWIVYGADGDAATGYEGAATLFSRCGRLTALFCFNDRVAMGAYEALSGMGRRIPDDVAVVGFDNYEVISANLRPELTSMQLPHYEMGKWAVETLLRISQNQEKSGSSPQVTLPCPLVMRKSI